MDDDTAFERAKALFLEGNDCFAAGRFADAAARFEAALELVPGRVSTLANLGAARVRAGRHREAIPVLEQAIAIEPDDLHSHGHLAIAYRAVGRHADALACHDRVLAAEPEHAASWLARGESLRFLERHDDALVAFERANQVDPTLAAAWTQRGNILRDQGRLAEARHAFEQALAHQGDPELNRYFLAALSGRDAPPQAPTAYVLRFFDEYASSFDEHLVGSLGYRAPEALVAQVAALAQRRFRSALDLGCGTGLCGPLLRPMCDRLAGVDLSPGMLAQAAARDVYDVLVRAEIVTHLRATDARHDLLVAADVFIYIGALGPVFEGAARALAPDGLFCVHRGSDGERERRRRPATEPALRALGAPSARARGPTRPGDRFARPRGAPPRAGTRGRRALRRLAPLTQRSDDQDRHLAAGLARRAEHLASTGCARRDRREVQLIWHVAEDALRRAASAPCSGRRRSSPRSGRRRCRSDWPDSASVGWPAWSTKRITAWTRAASPRCEKSAKPSPCATAIGSRLPAMLAEEDRRRRQHLDQAEARLELLAPVAREARPRVGAGNHGRRARPSSGSRCRCRARTTSGRAKNVANWSASAALKQDRARPAFAGAERVAVAEAAAGDEALELVEPRAAGLQVGHVDVVGVEAGLGPSRSSARRGC